MHRLTSTWWGRNIVCLSADQLAENILEHSGVNVKRLKLEGRNGILTWKWILEYLDRLWNHVETRGMPTATAPMEIPTVPPPAPPPPEVRVHSNCGMICDPSYVNPAKTKVIGKVVRYTNSL